nr:hypothetical protein [Tanacetum cinerariifolium]
ASIPLFTHHHLRHYHLRTHHHHHYSPHNPPAPPLLTTEPTTTTATCPPAESISGSSRVHSRPKDMNDLDNATLHINGQSTEVDVPPDIIIDVVDKDDDITDDEDAIPHDLAESDNEDLINVDDDCVDKVYSSEEED